MSKSKKAPFKGLTLKQYMRKKHPDITLKAYGDTTVLIGEFCGYASGPMTDTGCINVCERYSSCDEAMHIGDLAKLVEGGYGMHWCQVCGDVIPESSDEVRVTIEGKRFIVCSEGCADVLRATT